MFPSAQTCPRTSIERSSPIVLGTDMRGMIRAPAISMIAKSYDDAFIKKDGDAITRWSS